MKECVVCRKELVGRQRLYCGVNCKMRAYWRKKYGSEGRLSLEEALYAANFYRIDLKAPIDVRNIGRYLAMIYGQPVDKVQTMEDGTFRIAE